MKSETSNINISENIALTSPHSNVDTSDSHVNIENFELLSDDSDLALEELPDIPPRGNDNDLGDEDKDISEDISKTLLFELDEVHQIMSKEFEETSNNNKPVKFSFEIELDPGLLELLLLNQLYMWSKLKVL